MRDSLALCDIAMALNQWRLMALRHHFFDRSSFIAAMSSICSANSRSSFAFSSSSAFSRLASDTVISKYFALQA